jgi:hypothetical protein
MFQLDQLSDRDQALYLELGPDEVTSRMAALSAYDIAWAKFAESLGKDVVVDGRDIKIIKDDQALAETVLRTARNERYARDRAEREAAKTA